MHNTVLDSHEQLKTFEKELKTLSKDLQGSMKEKEVAERQKTEALKTYAKVELDVRDVEDRIRLEAKTKVRRTKHVENMGLNAILRAHNLSSILPVH